MGVDLSPRRLARILDAAFDLYRANFRSIALASSVVVFPAALLVGVAQVFYARGLLEFIPVLLSGEIVSDEIGSVQIWSTLSSAAAPVFMGARLYMGSALFAAAPGMLAGERPGPWELLRGGWPRFGWVVLVAIIVSVLTGLAALALLLPAVFVFARLSVAQVVTVVEGVPLDRAIARSWALTRSRVWRTIGFIIALTAITFAFESAITAPSLIRQVLASVSDPEAVFSPVSAGWKTFEGTLSAAATSLAYPFVQLAWFFYYLDLRARREGMDLVLAAREIRERR